jgi:hypothetical protein
MGIWANLLGTIEDKINFAAIPANNRYEVMSEQKLRERLQQRFWIPQYLSYKLIRKEDISN